MIQKKFGAHFKLRNSIVRRHLFFNSAKMLALDEVKEYLAGGRPEKWWEVYRVAVDDSCFSLRRELAMASPEYSVAWDFVSGR